MFLNVSNEKFKSTPLLSSCRLESSTRMIIKKTTAVQNTGCRNIGIQTEKREIGTQSDPYSPPLINFETTDNELLKISHFKFGKELPITLDILFSLDEICDKEALERALPPLTDECSFKMRGKLMEDQELKEWNRKEETLKKAQIMRLNFKQNVLIERERVIERENFDSVLVANIKRLAVTEQISEKIEKKKLKIVRKLIRQHKLFRGGLEKDEFSPENALTNSKLKFFPMTQIIGRKPLTRPQILQDIDIDALANWIPKKALEVQIDEQGAISNQKKMRLDRQRAKTLQLNKKEEVQTQNDSESKDLIEGMNAVKIRPETPYLPYCPELANYPHQEAHLDRARWVRIEDDIRRERDKHRLAFLLQRMVRGRAIQNLLFDGKEKRLALIEELLVVANVDAVDEIEQREKNERAKKQAADLAKLNGLQGALLAEAIDKMAMEKKRVAMKIEFEKELNTAIDRRFELEAEEAGRRQAELVLKKREEKLYEEVCSIAYCDAESLLSQTLAKATAYLAQKNAQNITRIKEKNFSKYMAMNEEHHDVLVNDLMHCFLLPNVDKAVLQKKIEIEQRKRGK